VAMVPLDDRPPLRITKRCDNQRIFDASTPSTLALRGGTSFSKSQKRALCASDSNNEASSAEEEKARARQRTDAILAKFTSYFPLYLIIASGLGLYHPPSLTWVTSKPWIVSLMLSFVMMGTGLKLRLSDFTKIFSGSDKMSVPIGLFCQLLITPLVALASSHYFLLRSKNGMDVLNESRRLLHLGLVLVGCSPAGAISNLMSLLSGANVALSVLLTSVSTLLSTAMTPFRVKSLIGGSATDMKINGMALCIATVKVILLPVLSGMAINAAFPLLTTNILARYAPLISVALGSIICGGVVASNAPIMAYSAEAASLLLPMMCAILVFHGISFLLGYLVPRFFFRCDEKISRTISFQTAMPNAILAVVLAQSLSAGQPSSSQMLLTALPGAVSATCSICMAGMISSFWASSKNKSDV